MISCGDPTRLLLIGSLAVVCNDANIFINVPHLQGHAIDSVHGIAGIAASLLGSYSGFKAARFAFPRDFNLFTQEALQLVADTLQGIYHAGAVGDQDVVAPLSP